MKLLLMTTFLVALMLTIPGPVSFADETEKTESRKYKHDFEGLDLSTRKQNRKKTTLKKCQTTTTLTNRPQSCAARRLERSPSTKPLFQKLDKNEDDVLSGSEMKGLEKSDSDGDGEITLAEFLAGS